MLQLTGLRKRYGTVVALDGLSLRARPGRILGFLGPNGAGKTTAMRSVFGLVRLDEGQVHWRDAPVTTQARLRFGYMPEQRGLYRRMPAQPQLAWMAQLHGVDKATARRSAGEWLGQLGLAERVDDPVSELSHGNQQRVQLAAALVHEPELLVLDEPFSGLDPLGVAAMSEVLVERARLGTAVVFSSHQLDLVEDLVDDVVIVAGGRDRLAGTLDEVRSSTGTLLVSFRLAGGELPDTIDLPGDDGVEARRVTGSRDGGGRLRVPTSADPAMVMATVAQYGAIERFTFEPPALSQVFREVVGMSVAEAEAHNTTQEVPA